MTRAPALPRPRVGIACALMILVALVLLGRGTHPASATGTGPPNDDLANFRIIAGTSGSVENDIDGATRQQYEPAAAGQHTVWFRWVSPFTGPANFNTDDSVCTAHDNYGYTFTK